MNRIALNKHLFILAANLGLDTKEGENLWNMSEIRTIHNDSTCMEWKDSEVESTLQRIEITQKEKILECKV